MSTAFPPAASRRRLVAAAATALLTCLGCGGNVSRIKGPTGTVEGTVTLAGEHAPAGTIVAFYNPASGVSASGVVDGHGRYFLKTGEGNRLSLGEYVVTVTPAAAENEMTPDEMMQAYAAGRPPAPPASGIPERYRHMDTSGLTREVKEGRNVFDLALDE